MSSPIPAALSATPGLLLVGGLCVLGVLGALGLWWWRRRREARARAAARRLPSRTLRHPVVLLHGVMGFDEVKLAGRTHAYFRGVPERLRQLGADVHVVRVPATGSVAARAEALARAVRSIDAERVNLIAHSMGGLDARYAISQLGLAPRVASLTTVGTPHQGTPLADVGSQVLGAALGLERLARLLSLSTDAFHDLTTARLQAFNRLQTNAPGVLYASVVGAFGARSRDLNPVLLPTWLYLSRLAGANDGLVPASSQAWGEVLATLEADHWAQVGWSLRFDVERLYQPLFHALRERGV
jgi:triacylglycerol lipase